VEIVSKVGLSDLEDFVNRFSSSIYHTPQWKSFLERAFGYYPFYLFAVDESGQVVGFLPLFRVSGLFSRDRLCSVPFGHVCGPLGSAKTRNLLIQRAVELVGEGYAGALEVRESVGSPFFREVNSFSTFVLGLTRDPFEVWRRLDKGSVRWAVNKAAKRGVRVERTHDVECVKAFYELNCLTKRNLGVPCHPWSYFETMFEVFGEEVWLYLAKKGGDMIGGGVFLYHKDQVLYGYGAADLGRLNDYPYNAFIWESIKNACEEGYSSFDFGRTSYADVGLSKFKKRWGADEKKLFYSYFPADAADKVLDRRSVLLSTVKECVSRVPLPIYKKFSDLVFRNFG